jgi:hypothetical protein
MNRSIPTVAVDYLPSAQLNAIDELHQCLVRSIGKIFALMVFLVHWSNRPLCAWILCWNRPLMAALPSKLHWSNRPLYALVVSKRFFHLNRLKLSFSLWLR